MRPSLRLLAGLLGLHGAGALRGRRPIWELRKEMEASEQPGGLRSRAAHPAHLYPAYNLSVPVDHFHNDSLYEPHSNGTFDLRYWFDARHYRAGGPVIVLLGGESDGLDRLPFLQKGIVAKLAEATHGVGVVLEHRYYGASLPTADLGTASLRFLTTDQALADTAYFARHARFPGLEGAPLDPAQTAWIAYGGSYAGAFAAFLRKLYPDVYWGAIASSAVTLAVYDYWEYFEAARRYGPRDCIETTQRLTHALDNIMIGRKGTDYPRRLRAAFGLQGLTHDDDFAYLISQGIQAWQGKNWDPEVDEPEFDLYCANVTSDVVLYPAVEDRRAAVEELLDVGGYGGDQVHVLANRTLNYIGWNNASNPCNRTADECFGNYNTTFYQQDSLRDTWRLWSYQYCTQWGYMATGSGAPADQLPLVSRLIDVASANVICREAFNITSPPDLDAINRHGGLALSYPRLAFVDGEADPWLPVTPHAPTAPPRHDTTAEPFILMGGRAVHHWDENGLFANETTADLPPRPVADAQRRELEFVAAWMREWKDEKEREEGRGDQAAEDVTVKEQTRFLP